MQDIAKRLKILRRRLLLTQSGMAERLGISLSLYSKLETGNHKLQQAQAENICRKLAIPESWLLEGKGTLPEELLSSTAAVQGAALGVKQIEAVVQLAQNQQFRELAQQISDTMQLPFPRALAIVIREKINQNTD